MFIRVSETRHINIDVIAEVEALPNKYTITTKRGEKIIVDPKYRIRVANDINEAGR